jgi:hypothetical protein
VNCRRSASSRVACTAPGRSANKPRHLRRRLEVALGIRREPAAGAHQRDVLANRGDDIEQRPLFGRRERDAAGRQQRHAKRLGETDQRIVVVFLVAVQVALQLDVGIAAAERADDAIEEAADAEPFGAEQRAAGHGDEAGGEAVELMNRQRALAFRRAELHLREQTTQISPALLRRT